MKSSSPTRKRWLLATLVVAAALTVATAFGLRSPAVDTTPQEIVLIAKDVAFFVDGQPAANPVLHLTRGRPVKLIVRNDEPGKVLHCFTLSAFNAKTTQNLATGESEALTFIPTESGTFTYACLMHPMMAGQVVVR